MSPKRLGRKTFFIFPPPKPPNPAPSQIWAIRLLLLKVLQYCRSRARRAGGKAGSASGAVAGRLVGPGVEFIKSAPPPLPGLRPCLGNFWASVHFLCGFGLGPKRFRKGPPRELHKGDKRPAKSRTKFIGPNPPDTDFINPALGPIGFAKGRPGN